MLFGQVFASFLSIGRFLLLAGKSSLESFEPRLCLTIVPRVGDGVSLGVGQEALESDINPKLQPCWNMPDLPLGVDTELAVVAICPSNNANALDQLERNFLDALS